jgi:hypothetical protein
MIITVLGLIGIAALAIEIAYHSDLSYQIKKIFYITEDKLQKLGILSKPKFWIKYLPKYLFPLMIIPLLLFFIWHKFVELINCPYCTGFWLAFGFNLTQGLSVIQSIALTGITLISVYIIQLIDKYLCQ